jgi:SAM-dependent methyltransferase
VLSEHGLADWEAFSSTPLYEQLATEGKLVATEVVDDDLPDVLFNEAAAVLEHERIPFVSYPYEWPFAMLRDAALLQLELVRRSLDHGLILKDSTPYNVQFRGARPIFVDVGSFERMRDGEPWAGYRQFCMLFLFPLMLQAWKDLPFQPWLRGSLEGLTATETRNLLTARDLFRRGVPTHVALHARLERRYADTEVDVKSELKKSGFRKELIAANVRGLEKRVRRLEWKPSASAWSEYGPTSTYTEDDARRKAEFVGEAVRARRPRLVWDIGCNEGRHARIAAETADYVVAMDADAVVVDGLYRSLKDEGNEKILPLVVDVVDASPGLGWRGLERRPLADRGQPDLALCLAVLHHVSISGTVPVAAFLDWLRSLDAALVIEFPTPEDPMVRRLLARKRPNDHPDYRRDWFEQALAERFDVERSEELAGATRVLYDARPKA